MEELDPDESAERAAGRWWDANADEYLREYGAVLGVADFIWGPEGLSEDEAHVLGPLEDLREARILEIGAGAAHCSRYLTRLGCSVVASDISATMLRRAADLSEASGIAVPLVAADATALPFSDGSFSLVFTSFGALAFVEDLGRVFSQVHRVLEDGGIFAYSAPHPVRWMFPDSPSRRDMTVTTSYFSRVPYVERTDDGELDYAEFPHTLADHVGALARSGFVVEGLWEPEWPADRTVVWGAWGPERSPWIPGTLIVRARRRSGSQRGG
ncbi:MAG: class I SAM-dependent methyltransferase [Actinomycetaceae bacterium]|nr:class I SAM-dependent methyltransferase [Actinomycetaceae bacterium]